MLHFDVILLFIVVIPQFTYGLGCGVSFLGLVDLFWGVLVGFSFSFPFPLGLGHLSGLDLGFCNEQRNAFVWLTKGICLNVWKELWSVGTPKHLCCFCWWPQEGLSCFGSFCCIVLPHKFKPLCSVRAGGSISCAVHTHARARSPSLSSYVFLVVLLCPCKDTCSSQNHRTGSQNFHCLGY